MKEPEFIALLNLYLDHEISPADAARLEAEVQANPARRRIYQQYCRMQKACKLAAADFQTEPQVAAGDRKVVPINAATAGQRKQASNLYTVGAFVAAAACIAVVLVGRSRQQADQAASAEFAHGAPAPTANAKSVTTPGSVQAPSGLVSVANGSAQNDRVATSLVSDSLRLTGNAPSSLTLMVDGQVPDQLAWITAVQLTPLQQRVPADELRFDAHPVTLRPEGRALGGNRATTEAAEMNAFNFTK
jgi:anti-sigma factor RsiW